MNFCIKTTLLAFVFTSLGGGYGYSQKTAIAKDKLPPNFILILVDDQAWNGTSVQMMNQQALSKSDYYQTPNTEVLATEGMRFSDAYAAAPVCAPSRYAIQFGKTPARLRMVRVGMNTAHINHNTPISIPKLLKQINPKYRAAHFGKWGMGSDPSTLEYDQSDGPTKNKDGGFDHKAHKKQWESKISEDPKKIFSITQRANNFMAEQVKANHPFFLQISHYAIHSDVMMRKQTLEKYKNKPKGKYQNHTGLAAMTEDLDTGIGLLLEKIKSLGIQNNTYIIYTSDNGSVPVAPPRRFYKTSYNYPLSRGKWDALEGGIRVPLIISGPKIAPNTVSKIAVSGIDLLPTIIDLAGGKIPKPNTLDGVSIKNILFNKGKAKIKRKPKGLVFHVPYENGIALKRAHSAIRIGQYKLIKFHDNNQTQLFDITKDLAEKHNLANALPKKAKALEKALDQYLTKVKALKWKKGITWKKGTIEEINSFY